MKRDHTNLQPFLMPISGMDACVLQEALVEYAVEADKDGDSISASRAYAIARRARELSPIDLEASSQALSALGRGFRTRPQG